MTPAEYIEALHTTGIAREIAVMDLDRAAAALLKIDERTARRYRNGDTIIPGPVQVALHALAAPPA